MIWRYSIAWLGLAILAFVNGTLREFVYGPYLPERAAHQVSTLTLILLTGAFAWLVHRAWPLRSAAQAWKIGAIWLLATVLFEFGFGRFVAGHPWSRLLADYNLLQGRVWPVFLAWILILPVLVHRTSRNRGAP